MRFKYSTNDPSQSEYDSLPRLPLTLRLGNRSIEVVGLVDSGATVNVLPYEVGLRLGAQWEDTAATLPLQGCWATYTLYPYFQWGK